MQTYRHPGGAAEEFVAAVTDEDQVLETLAADRQRVWPARIDTRWSSMPPAAAEPCCPTGMA